MNGIHEREYTKEWIDGGKRKPVCAGLIGGGGSPAFLCRNKNTSFFWLQRLKVAAWRRLELGVTL